jgi:hypothetical protein
MAQGINYQPKPPCLNIELIYFLLFYFLQWLEPLKKYLMQNKKRKKEIIV